MLVAIDLEPWCLELILQQNEVLFAVDILADDSNRVLLLVLLGGCVNVVLALKALAGLKIAGCLSLRIASVFAFIDELVLNLNVGLVVEALQAMIAEHPEFHRN